jgi:5'-phosphate synthase pdxT subunit
MARVGVLALQGDFSAHAAMLRALGAEVHEVRRSGEVAGLDGLVLPGGESTTLLKLMADEPWFDTLRDLRDDGKAFLATCAGTILLAREVVEPPQPSVGLLDAVVERNAYGRQVDSFEARLDAPSLGSPLPAVFIRAPRFRGLGSGVEVLARHEDLPVLVRQGRILAATFHPELTGDDRIHRHFLDLASAPRTEGRHATRLAS